MFRELTDYSAKKNWFQATIYFTAWTVILLALIGVPSAGLAMKMGVANEKISTIGSLIVLVAGEYLIMKTMKAKSLEGPWMAAYVIQAFFSLGSFFTGLIVPAYLTTVRDQTDITKPTHIHQERL